MDYVRRTFRRGRNTAPEASTCPDIHAAAQPQDTVAGASPDPSTPRGGKIFLSAREFMESTVKLNDWDVYTEERDHEKFLLTADQGHPSYNLFLAEFQLIRIAKGLKNCQNFGRFEETRVQAWLAGIKHELDEPLYKALKDGGWSDNEGDNYDMSEPGSLVWIILWENLKNGEIAIEDPTRVSTDVGDWIKKRYLVLVHHRGHDDFVGYLITSFGRRGMCGVRGNPNKYARIFMRGAPFGFVPGEIPPFIVDGSRGFNLDENSLIYLEPRVFPLKQLMFSTGAQLGYRQRCKFHDITVEHFTWHAGQLLRAHNIWELDDHMQPHKNAFLQRSYDPPINGRPIFKLGQFAPGTAPVKKNAAVNPGNQTSDVAEKERLMAMSHEELVEALLATKRQGPDLTESADPDASITAQPARSVLEKAQKDTTFSDAGEGAPRSATENDVSTKPATLEEARAGKAYDKSTKQKRKLSEVLDNTGSIDVALELDADEPVKNGIKRTKITPLMDALTADGLGRKKADALKPVLDDQLPAIAESADEETGDQRFEQCNFSMLDT